MKLSSNFLSGPPLAALALAGVALAVSVAGRRPHRLLFLPLVFAVLVVAAGRTHVTVGPQGDEPHYLMVAESLLRDGDLALERDYAERRYALFHDTPLAPHYRVRGFGGVVYSLHAVGLSVLVLPAWALAGYAGVTVFMALLAAFLAREVRSWVRDLTGRPGLAEAAGWMAVLSPPLLPYAGLVFTEVPAALGFSLGLRLGRAPAWGIGRSMDWEWKRSPVSCAILSPRKSRGDSSLIGNAACPVIVLPQSHCSRRRSQWHG